MDVQALRAHEEFKNKDNDLERYIYLRALQDTNEVLSFRLVIDHLAAMMPIVYTPAVALGVQCFSHICGRPRGLFISYPLRQSMRQILRSRPNQQVDVIVVTDGERVLGIGDQGVGGMDISVGKVSLYTALGGIHPRRTLPVVLDVGTNNPRALDDPDGLGWRHARIDGQDYCDCLAQFVRAVKEELPRAPLRRAGVAPTTTSSELRQRMIAAQWTPAYEALG